MRNQVVRLLVLVGLLVATASVAQADICITIDQARDTLAAEERATALRLLTRQFALEGERVVPVGCPTPYVLAHSRLGNLILVSLSGPNGQREAIAQGADDLPAVYSQMVRSLITGRPMTGLNVVDRTNVTASQALVRRVHSDSIWYGRLGYGSLFGDQTYGTPAIGFGYRAEFDKLGLEVSFLNFQFRTSDSYYSSPGASAWSLLKLSGLYFIDPAANRTAYLGAGLSYGGQRFGGRYNGSTPFYSSDWDGRGLQSELTVGYELARATSLRLFIQADAIFPFYSATRETYSPYPTYSTRFTPPTVTTDRRYAPSLVVSIALGR